MLAEAVDIPPPVKREFKQIDDYSPADDARAMWAEIERLGLEKNIAELEVMGLTVVPPEKVAPPEFIARVREKILDVVEKRKGVRPDIEAGTQDRDYAHDPFNSQMASYLIFEDPIFEEVLMNPAGLALTDYLLGKNCCLSNLSSFIKGPGGDDLKLHCDTLLMPPPYPTTPQVCNVTWALTDYTMENGPLCYVPGSHRFHRQPRPGECDADRVAVEVPAGSMIFWGGNLWHGAFARTAPGLRMSILIYMARAHLRTEEVYPGRVTPEMLQRHPRLRTLLGQHINFGWQEEGPIVGSGDLVGRSYYE